MKDVSAGLAEKVWLTTREAAEYAGFSYEGIRKHLASGELKSSQAVPRGSHRVRREWVDEWLESRGAHRRAS